MNITPQPTPLYTLNLNISDLILDSAYNHLHHADAVRLLEKCRNEHLALKGYTLESLCAQDMFIVVSGIKVEYLREVKGPEATITFDSVKIERRRMMAIQQIYNEVNKAAVYAEIELAVLSKKVGRAIKVPDFLEQIYRV